MPVAECSDVVPPQLQLRLAQLWCNPLMDVIAPSWRACVSPYLATLSPHCARASAIAGHAEHAIESAEKMQKDAEGVLSGAVALSAWVENMPLALMATAFSPHKELVRTIIHTVVGTVANQMEAGQGAASLLEIASDILQTLLQHPVATVAAKSWAVVTQLLQQLLGSSEQHRVLVQLLVNDSCMRLAFGRMLPHGQEGERESAVQLLAAAVRSEEEAIIEGATRLAKFIVVVETHDGYSALGKVMYLSSVMYVFATEKEGEQGNPKSTIKHSMYVMYLCSVMYP